MKNSLVLIVSCGLALGSSITACKDDKNLGTPARTSLELPQTPYDYGNNGNNNDVPTLGRVLFYDQKLSVNNSVACGSCHLQSLAFSDNVSFSRGFENKLTLRNTLPIQNVVGGNGFQSTSLFWDGREKLLTSMVLKPILNHVEMGMSDVQEIVKKVKALPYYEELFMKAYNTPDIDEGKIADALSAFTSSIVSRNTHFDNFMNDKGTLSGIEMEGKQLFFSKYNCNSCHQTQVPNGYQMGGGFVNIGLDEVSKDIGFGNVSKMASDNGKFKIPNLRNIALTAPYMHDGRFKSLEEVLDHYSHGIANNANLDPRLRTNGVGAPIQMNISSQEKTAIIAFLNTLTDYQMITDPKFSNPFKTK